MKVLVVEDDPYVAGVLGRFCIRMGWTPSIEADGRAGLDRALSLRPQLLLLDLHLPDLCGLEICKSIRAAGLDTIVIVLTGSNTEDDCLASFGAGADDYMKKPINMRELKARINARTRTLFTEHMVGNVNLDRRRKRAFCCGKDIKIDQDRV